MNGSVHYKTFTKHASIRVAFHRFLINTGESPEELGKVAPPPYDYLIEVRETGDYDGFMHVTVENSKAALAKAREILDAVSNSNLAFFSR